MLLFLILLLVVLPLPFFLQVSAFKSHIIGGNEAHSGDPNHEDITSEALTFLKADTLSEIIDEHGYVDVVSQFDSSYHFDNCEFRGSSNTINSLYNRAINSLNPSSPDIADARNAFGQLLHTVQDFYSHSNWVELGQTDLVENGLNLWHVFSPLEVYRGFVVIQGEDAPSGVTLSRTGKIITANMPDGVFQGLITGAAYTTDDCPDDVTIGHWDSGGLGGNWPGENERLDGLNKDADGRPGYSEARSLAVQQTTHEWCRLLNLENTRNGGDGVKLIFQQWVNDQEGAIAACPELSDLRQIVSDTSEAIPDGQEGQMTCPDGSVGTSCPEETGASTPPAEDTPGQMTCPDGSVGTSCPEETGASEENFATDNAATQTCDPSVSGCLPTDILVNSDGTVICDPTIGEDCTPFLTTEQ
jgi:hypothetical protein